jgi:DNA-binding beta-propeller fold protein YncE
MGHRHRTLILNTVLIALAALCSFSSAAVAAEPPSLLWQTPEDGTAGSDAGRLKTPSGVAADPSTGHVYVADPGNHRIDEFTSWGEFVRAFGWKVNASNPEERLQVCTAATGCQVGSVGVGAGQLSAPTGINIDSSGDLYVSESLGSGSGVEEGARVQKFDPTAGPGEDEVEFVWALGGDVNKTKVEAGGATEAERNLCTAASGDVCQMGSFGAGQGQFNIPVYGVGARIWETAIAIAPDGDLYVADRGGEGGTQGRIQVFDSGGSFQSQFLLPKSGHVQEPGQGPPNLPQSLAIDPRNGDLYFDFLTGPHAVSSPIQPFVYRLSATGQLLGKLQLEMPGPIAVGPDGTVYTFELEHNTGPPEGNPNFQISELIEFDSSGNRIAGIAKLKSPDLPGGIAVNPIGPASEVVGDIYFSTFSSDTASVTAYGPPPEFELPPKVPPRITDQFAASVDSQGALLRAKINPQFWKDTTYYVEYGTGKCSEGDCTSAQPTPPGTTLTSQLVRSPLTASAFLTGLEPGTTYHYRFVAQSSGSEGQSVHGVGGKPGIDGEEAVFRTPPLPTPPPSPDTCPNAVFRNGASALLPDCRAYEMVSPVDKDNSDVATMVAGAKFRARLDQSAVSGDAFTFSANRAFAGSESGGWSSQYLSSRGGSGWSTQAISPKKEGDELPGGDLNGGTLDTPFKAFSPELDRAWITDPFAPNPDPSAPGRFTNVFRRDSATGAYEALVRAVPPHAGNETGSPHYPELQGISADGDHAIIRIADNLTPEAPDLGGNSPNQLYESYREGEGTPQLRLVSVFPNGSPATAGASAGTANLLLQYGRTDSVTHAISEDGSRIYWTAANVGPGKLYLRVNGAETLPVSESVGGDTSSARFWVASADGLRALFSFTAGPKAGNLYEFNAAKGKSKPIASKAIGLAGASEDLSRFYFASEEALAEGAVAGKPNLFVSNEGSFAFVAELSADDAKNFGKSISPVHPEAFYHTARASADGNALSFMSNSAPLAKAVAGYDNTDQLSGKADAEVYRYDAQTGQLSCASCNPTGARPIGDTMKLNSDGSITAASTLSNADSELYQPRYLSDDGTRLYFNSFEPLLPRDSNGTMDVYQWEAPGSGDCSEESPAFSESNDGCLTLISSGDSPKGSEFIDASSSGRDVFFTTLSSLVEQDTGLVDVYDARVEGGFPPPPNPPAPCEGEACQGPSPARNDETPASASYEGVGNVDEKPNGRCSKGKVRRKGHCVTRKRKAAKRKVNRKANHEQRAAR